MHGDGVSADCVWISYANKPRADLIGTYWCKVATEEWMQVTRPDGSVHASNYWGHGAVGRPAILLRWQIIVGANSFRQLKLEMTVGGPHYTDPLLIKQLAAFHHLVRSVNALV